MVLFSSIHVGKDQGINIRHKVSDMIEFIQDDDRLRDERKKAKKNKDKYVGMSSDAMGFRGSGSSGFDSGWKENWPSSSSSSGRRSGGFRDNSPEMDDDPYRQQPSPALSGGADDFRDDSPNTSFDSNKFGSSSGPTSLPTATSAAAAKKVAKKPRKPIDLGAAATFAQTAQPARPAAAAAAPPTKTDNSLIDDIFNNGGGASVNANPVDDFDPRGSDAAAAGYSSLASDANANNGGGFGDFSSAFGGNNGGANNGSNGGDGFADFSSAFSSTSSTAAPAASDNDLFANMPTASGLPNLTANPVRAPAPPSPQGDGGFDLLGGGGSASAAPSSSLDLLGGLDMGSSGGNAGGMPNLLPGSSVPPMMGGGVTAAPNVMNSMMGGPMSLPAQPMSPAAGGMLAPASVNPVSSTAKPAGNANAAKAETKIPERWGNVGGLNIDLDNLSLGGKNQTKKSVPMNAMKTSSSSSESPVSPLGGMAGFGGTQPNPMQPNYLAPQSSSSGLDGLL